MSPLPPFHPSNKARRRVLLGAKAGLLAAVAWVGVLAGREPVVAGEAAKEQKNEIPADAITVLDARSPWRWDSVWSAPFVSVEAQKAAGKDGAAPIPFKPKVGFASRQPSESSEVVPLPQDWKSPDFDDTGWTCNPLGIGNDEWFLYVPLIGVRGKFEVPDPKGLRSLSLTADYRGGAVVYLNGQEVARLDLPEGSIAPGTPGKLYPEEVWLDAAGKALPKPESCKGDDAARIAKRQRHGGPIELPVGALRKGTNVLAIELHRSDLHPIALTWWNTEEYRYHAFRGWAPIALGDVRLTAVGAGVTPNLGRPAGLQVWNCMPYDTITRFDFGEVGRPVRPVAVSAARNGVFSGRLVVSSDQAIKGLKVTVSDLAKAGGDGKTNIPASAVRVRCAEPADGAKTWMMSWRFDGLLDVIPSEIPANKLSWKDRNPYEVQASPLYWSRGPGALAPLWLTIAVPKTAAPGKYQGSIGIAADGLPPVTVLLVVDVSAWTVPDPKDFRMKNVAFLSEDAIAKHYGVPRWSDKHFELMGKSMALMAEVNSRQAIANLAIDFYGLSGNEETMVRWIKQPDGSYKYDFTVFDKYLDLVAKTMGKPTLLRVNCWNEVVKQGDKLVASRGGPNIGGKVFPVTLLDPATGKVEPMDQPMPGTEESFAFWKPVLDEVRKKVEARGWWDVTAMGHNSYCWSPDPAVVSICKRIWPDGVWSYTAHNGTMGMRFPAVEKGISMPVRHADALWTAGSLAARGYRALLKPRPTTWCFTFREIMRVYAPLTLHRSVGEDEIMRGHDGVSDFGTDLFPVKKEKGNGYYCLGNGRGTGGPNDSTRALLFPGPDGAVSTERFEMLREGMELAEAILFVQRALDDKKVSGDLEPRANRLLDERSDTMLKRERRQIWWPTDRFERDAQLLLLAGEVAAKLDGGK